jgi:hypothetical protein
MADNFNISGDIKDVLYNLYGTPDRKSYGGDLSTPSYGIAAYYDPQYQEANARVGNHSLNVARSGGVNTPKYKYQNENLNLEITPENAYANLTKKLNQNSTAGIYGNYGKAGNSIGLQYKRLLDNGFIDLNGNLTKEGYNLMLNGQVNF